MSKSEAIALFGSVTALARGLGITRQAIYQWPAELATDQADRVVGAAHRLGRALGAAAIPATSPVPAPDPENEREAA